MKKVIIVLLCAAAALLAACSNTLKSEQEPSSTIQIIKTPAPPPRTPVPTVPVVTIEPTSAVTAVIEVKDGDTLERDIIPQLTAAFSMNEDEVKGALEGAESSLIKKAKGFRRMEGMIVPGTYEIKGEDLDHWINMWIEGSQQRYDRIAAGVSDKNDLSPDKQLALASIVEWETTLCDSDEAEAAAVLLNRLKDGWKLECCATVEYTLGYQRPFLTKNDLKVKGDYNTYDFKGVTPGPICCIDDESLAAAIGESTNREIYFFFYDYVRKKILVFSESGDSRKKANTESRELFDSTYDIDPFKIMEDKREYFATGG